MWAPVQARAAVRLLLGGTVLAVMLAPNALNAAPLRPPSRPNAAAEGARALAFVQSSPAPRTFLPLPAPERSAPAVREAAEADVPLAIEVPLHASGFYLGDVSVQAERTGALAGVDGSRFAELLMRYLDTEAMQALRARLSTQSGRYVPLDLLQSDGLRVAYDPADLRLNVSVSVERTAAQSISLGGMEPELGPDTIYPARFSGAINLNLAQNWINRSRLRPETEGLEPITGTVEAFANLGGLDGVYLFAEGTVDAGAPRTFQRGTITLIKDLRESGVRVALGDVDPLGTILQGTASLGGIHVATAYGQIQPNRNIRPTGRTQFVLDQGARVDVEVNGAVIRTILLTPGRYDLRDLSLGEGLNDVRLFVQDTSGRREIAAFSSFFTSTLLDAGINDYSLAAGFAREPSPGGFRYLGDRPQATGYFRRGVTSNLTVGASGQADGRVVNLGLDGVLATPLGVFAAQMSASRSAGRSGYAHAFGHRLTGRIAGYAAELETAWDYRSARFRALNEFDLVNATGHEVSTRLRLELPWGISATVGAGWTQRRAAPDDRTFSLSLGKAFGALNTSVLVDSGRALSGSRRTRLLATAIYRLGLRSSVRAQFRSRLNEHTLEFERSARNGIDEWGFRAGYTGSEDSRALQGEAELFTNRGEFGVRTGRVEAARGRDLQHVTTARAALGLAFADGRFGLGRPVTEGFALVAGHRTLGGRPVVIGGLGTTTPLARSGAFGPALAPLARAYQVQSLSVSVADLPPGYDIGAGRFTLFPGARSGFVLTVGSAAANTAIGTLVGADGKPVPLRAGELRSIERPKDAPLPFFTNRTGRFVSERLSPGRYRMILDGQDTGLVIAVPEDASGLVEIGRLRIGEP